MNDIVVVTFNDPSNAYQALSALKELDSSGRLVLRSAVVVERQANGQAIVHDSVDAMNLYGEPRGLIGQLLDGLSGRGETASIAGNIPAGATGLIAELDEYAVEVIDGSMSQLGGRVYREETDYVDAELTTAKDEHRAAEKREEEAERQTKQRERERERAEKHNARLDHLESLLEKSKDTVPPPVASTEGTAQK